MATGHEVVVGIVGFLLLAAPFYSFYKLVETTHKDLYVKTLRISVLSCRTALFLPIYSICMWISLVIPVLYLPMQIPISIAEGYCFYSFFSMIVNYFDGGNKTASVLEEVFQSGKKPLCPCCCPENGRSFYQRILNALWHFYNTRTVIVLIVAILQMFANFDSSIGGHGIKRLRIFIYLFTFVSVSLLGNGFLSLVMFFEMLYEKCKNISGTFKLLLLKFAVGLIVIQGLVEEFLFTAGYINLPDNESFNGEERALRYYCLIVIGEYSLLSTAVYYAYSVEILPLSSRETLAQSDTTVGTRGASEKMIQPEEDNVSTYSATTIELAHISFEEYTKKIFAFSDVWDDLELTNNGLQDPLNVNVSSNDQTNYHNLSGGAVV